jgi:hypothetical protein
VRFSYHANIGIEVGIDANLEYIRMKLERSFMENLDQEKRIEEKKRKK